MHVLTLMCRGMGLNSNQSLKTLLLGSNFIYDEGFEQMIIHLGYPKRLALNKIDFSCNSLKFDNLKTLTRLMNSTKIASFNFLGNFLDDKTLKFIKKYEKEAREMNSDK